ncbi:MAG: DUF6512 family protein [Acidobacteriota bacterium]
MKNNLFWWEITGIFVIFILGSLWHFVFEWSGGSFFLSLIAPVNESVWEHFKLGLFPSLVYSLVAYYYVGRNQPNFVAARTVALYLIPIATAALYYLYQAVFLKESLAVDIFIFFLSVVIAQIASYLVMTRIQPLPPSFNYVAVLAGLALFALFAATTYYPPHMEVFRDSNTGEFGAHLYSE